MIPLLSHNRAINSAPHRPFCLCLYQVAFIFVVVAMFRSLSVRTVIVGNVIAAVNAVIKPGLNRLNGQAKNTRQLRLVASIMPLDNNALEIAVLKK